jgi:hypothetical protein
MLSVCLTTTSDALLLLLLLSLCPRGSAVGMTVFAFTGIQDS